MSWRNLNENWNVYQNSSGRIFYHNTQTKRSSWKPPRKLKPAPLQVPKDVVDSDSTSPPTVVSMVRDSIRDLNGRDFVVPPGYVEFYEKSSGIILVIQLNWLLTLFKKVIFIMKTYLLATDGLQPLTKTATCISTHWTQTQRLPDQNGHYLVLNQ